jgi:benzodiazapine receptor
MKVTVIHKVVIAFLLPQCLGMIAGLVTAPNIPGWYVHLIKPSFTPPAWVFAPAWLILYVMMGAASFLVWRTGKDVRTLRLYFVHLGVNFLWSILFFGLHSPFWAFVDILVLWAMIAVLIVLFARVSRLAMVLLIPYWGWVSFAAVLNYSVWVMNRV